MVRKLAGIRCAELGARADAQIEPALDQRRIARQRHAAGREAGAQALERQPCCGRDVAKGVPLGRGGARYQRHAVREHEALRRPDAQRRIADTVRVAGTIESRNAAILGKAVGAQMREGELGERLGRNRAERDAVSGLAEDLAGGAAVVRTRAVEEARKDDRARGVDGVERESGAAAQIEQAEPDNAGRRDTNSPMGERHR
jgi:hypothetical protein